MQGPINTMKLFVNKLEQKLPHKKEMQNIEELKSQCEVLIRQVCAGMPRLQKTFNEEVICMREKKQEKGRARRKRRNISEVDLLKENRK